MGIPKPRKLIESIDREGLTKRLKAHQHLIKVLDRALFQPKGVRFRLIRKLLYPEMTKVANALSAYYLVEEEYDKIARCWKCGATDIESPGLDYNRYCNVCHVPQLTS